MNRHASSPARRARSSMLFGLLVALTVAGSVVAADLDGDGLSDRPDVPMPGPAPNPDAAVAIVDLDHVSVLWFWERLVDLGMTPTVIPRESDPATFGQYDLVLLPIGSATGENLGFFASMAAQYVDFVAGGGRLYVAQPNPAPHGAEAIVWLPYHLVVGWWFDLEDCPAAIADAGHCIAQGLDGADLPTAADTVVELDPAWDVVAAGSTTGSPSVLYAEYGEGKVLVDLGQPAPDPDDGFCPYTQAGFSSMIMCLLGDGPVRTEARSLSELRSVFR